MCRLMNWNLGSEHPEFGRGEVEESLKIKIQISQLRSKFSYFLEESGKEDMTELGNWMKKITICETLLLERH